jgi:hypothetical protein
MRWKALLDAFIPGPAPPSALCHSARPCLLPQSRRHLAYLQVSDDYLGDAWMARVPLLTRGSVDLGGGLRLHMCISTTRESGTVAPQLTGHVFVDLCQSFHWKSDDVPRSERGLRMIWPYSLDSTALRNVLARLVDFASAVLCPTGSRLKDLCRTASRIWASMEQSYDPKKEFSADLRFAHRRAEREGRARVASFTLKPPANATLHDPTPAAIFLAFLHCSQQNGVRSEVHEHQLGVYLLRALTSSGVPPGTYPQATSFFAALVALLRSLPPSSRPQLFRIAAAQGLAAFGVVSLPASVRFPSLPVPFPSAAAVASNVPPPLADLDVTLHRCPYCGDCVLTDHLDLLRHDHPHVFRSPTAASSLIQPRIVDALRDFPPYLS